MFYKIIPLLVDYIVKNDIFAPKSPKLGNIYIEVILSETNDG